MNRLWIMRDSFEGKRSYPEHGPCRGQADHDLPRLSDRRAEAAPLSASYLLQQGWGAELGIPPSSWANAALASTASCSMLRA